MLCFIKYYHSVVCQQLEWSQCCCALELVLSLVWLAYLYIQWCTYWHHKQLCYGLLCCRASCIAYTHFTRDKDPQIICRLTDVASASAQSLETRSSCGICHYRDLQSTCPQHCLKLCCFAAGTCTVLREARAGQSIKLSAVKVSKLTAHDWSAGSAVCEDLLT